MLSPVTRHPLQVTSRRFGVWLWLSRRLGSVFQFFSFPAFSSQASGLRLGRSLSMLPLVTRHSPHATGRQPAAFTLIELLVVIAIIAILAGLGFPALQGALNSGKKAQARNDVQQIAAAVRAYQAEYGRLPSAEVTQDEYTTAWFQQNNREIINALIGNNSELNPRNIVFLDSKRVPGTKGGIGTDGTFYDPWGTPYGIKLDLSYDNKLEYYDAGRAGLPNVFSTVVVVSFGPNKIQQDPYASTDEGQRVDDLVSFK